MARCPNLQNISLLLIQEVAIKLEVGTAGICQNTMKFAVLIARGVPNTTKLNVWVAMVATCTIKRMVLAAGGYLRIDWG